MPLNGNNIGTPPFNPTTFDLVAACTITGTYKRLGPGTIGVYSNLSVGTIQLPAIGSFAGGTLKVVDLGNNAGTNNWTVSVAANTTDQINDHGASAGSWTLNVNNIIAEFSMDGSVWDVVSFGG